MTSDKYCEHLVTIKKNRQMISALLFLWIGIAAVIVLCLLVIRRAGLFSLLLSAAAIYGGVVMTKKLNIEYEYLATNGDLDIDMIVGREKRKRLLSLNCRQIVSVQRYAKGKLPGPSAGFSKISVYCNPDDSDAYTLIFSHPKMGKLCLTLDLPKEMQEAMLPYMDALLAREAFRD